MADTNITVAETSGKAITSMVLGILAVTIPPGVVLGLIAIPFAVSARRDIRYVQEAGSDLKGNGMAIAGLVTGIIGIILWAALLAIWIWVLRDTGGEPVPEPYYVPDPNYEPDPYDEY